jgi:hypothetical protein
VTAWLLRIEAGDGGVEQKDRLYQSYMLISRQIFSAPLSPRRHTRMFFPRLTPEYQARRAKASRVRPVKEKDLFGMLRKGGLDRHHKVDAVQSRQSIPTVCSAGIIAGRLRSSGRARSRLLRP